MRLKIVILEFGVASGKTSFFICKQALPRCSVITLGNTRNPINPCMYGNSQIKIEIKMRSPSLRINKRAGIY